MLTAMFAALAVLTPSGFNPPASHSVVRLGTHAGCEVSASATKTALRAPPNLWGTELATHGLQAQAGSATMGAAPAHNELQRCATAAETGRCFWPQPNAPGTQPAGVCGASSQAATAQLNCSVTILSEGGSLQNKARSPLRMRTHAQEQLCVRYRYR